MVRPRLWLGQEGIRLSGRFFSGGLLVFCGKGGFYEFRAQSQTQTCSRSHYNVGVTTVIRAYQPEDFETLWRMDQECFTPGIAYSKLELKTYIRSRSTFTLVAVGWKSEEILGFIVAHTALIGHIITIDVSPKARRSGVGSLLLLTAEERLRATGSHAVGLETAVDNLSALAFYKRHGYHVVRTWPRYYSNGVDALVLRKELAEPE